MSDQLKPVRCGCGGEAEIFHIAPDGYAGSYCVRCVDCLTQSPFFTGNKEKAIEVWNRAMGERIAKVSNQIFNNSNPYIVGAWIGTCECGELVSYSSKYCHMCGAKLDWGENG